jgi:ADP-dependent NAD(P)H-hydrate dehydratase / NAD(P)H-hydrate epimerase
VKIVSVEQMRALEATALAAGISEADLQRRAGTAAAEEVARIGSGGRVAVLVGHGNNGRDGAVAAEWLLSNRVPVDLLLAPRHAVTPDELHQLRSLGASVTRSEDRAGVDAALSAAAVGVDALAGIGIKGPLREPLASMAAQLNAHRAQLRVVALDLPSGIDADSGEVPGEAVWANATVTLGGVKQGLLRFPAAERVGQLIAREIGIPPETELPNSLIDDATLSALVPRRALGAHKYRFGRVLVIAGSDHFLGAPVLCAGGAARVGAGLITVASTRDVRMNVAAHLPEATFTIQDVSASDGASAARSIEEYLQSHTSAVLGPGLGRSPSTTEFVAEVLRLRNPEHGLVVDADGLVALAELPDWPRLLGPNTVLTPHTGELARLVGDELDASETDWDRAGRLAREWGCVLIAKGPFTAVARHDARADVWPRANAALATGGTGDVLAGMTAGLLAQGLSAWDAARLAVGLHGRAAARITERRRTTLLASDLFAEIPAILGALTPRR